MNSKSSILFAFLFSSLFFACQPDKGKEIPDVSHIPIDIDIRRFDKDLFEIDTLQIEKGLAKIESKYPEFGNIYFGQILGSTDKRIAPEGHIPYVKGFATHPATRQLFDTTQIVFPQAEMQKLETEFEQAFQYLKYYFPDVVVPPHVTTFISEYTIAAFVYKDNALALGLDFFLGPEYPYVEYNPGNPHFSQYLVRSFNKEHVVSKTLKPLVKDILGIPSGNRLLDYMLHNGKELYIMSHLLPHEPDSVILEYSQAQVDWVEENEKEMWHHFLREDLLYSTDIQKFKKLIDYSPNSPGMPKEAPGRTANWLGWQMVKSYMKRFPETTFEELINLQDAQTLMDQSRYKPAL